MSATRLTVFIVNHKYRDEIDEAIDKILTDYGISYEKNITWDFDVEYRIYGWSVKTFAKIFPQYMDNKKYFIQLATYTQKHRPTAYETVWE